MDKTTENYIKCLHKRIEYLQSKESYRKDESGIEVYTLEIVIEDLQELGGTERFSYWKDVS